jgi:hypothetical protein
MADGDQRQLGIVDAQWLTTNDGIGHSLCSFTVPDDCSVYLRGRYIAQRDNLAANIQGGEVLAVANAVGGAVTVQGSSQPADLQVDPGGNSWVVDFEDSAALVGLVVYGGAGETIIWYGTIEVLKVEANI